MNLIHPRFFFPFFIISCLLLFHFILSDVTTRFKHIFWKVEFEEKAKGKIVLKADQYDVIKKLKKRIKTNELAQHYLKGEKELSHYLEYEGLPVRVRPDVINYVDGYIADIKKTRYHWNLKKRKKQWKKQRKLQLRKKSE